MKYLLVVIAVSIHAVTGQDKLNDQVGIPDVLVGGPNTINIEEQDGPMQCVVGVGDGEIRDCPSKGDVCQTKLEIKKGMHGAEDKMLVFRECKQLEACDANLRSNFRQCYSRGALVGENVRICHFCCFGNQCNAFRGLPLEFRKMFGINE